MRNELHFWLKWLHRGVQYSRFFLESDQNYLCLMETQEEWRMLSCSFTDEVQLVAHPVGIAWEEFLANQAQLRSNQLNYREELHGVRGLGQALLQGIVRCGYCGAFLHLRYSDPHGEFPVYVCNNDKRQYQAVEPENRLGARSLERQWEEKLRAIEAVEKEYQAWRSTRLAPITEVDRASILALGSDLPSLCRCGSARATCS
jgi:Recombinase zinc beta ribbon domain